MSRDSIVSATSAIVQILRVLNVLLGVAAILLMIGSFVFHDRLMAQLVGKYGAGFSAETAIWLMRGLFVIGVLAVGVIERLLKNLGEVLATLRAGDPFVDANARRVTIIAWMLLLWQLLELGLGTVAYFVQRIGADSVTWTPSLGGWLAVLVAFVLARVFAAGSRMRDELATTI